MVKMRKKFVFRVQIADKTNFLRSDRQDDPFIKTLSVHGVNVHSVNVHSVNVNPEKP